MLAPEPFFEPRGTPFSEFHRIRALADLGHTVDLVTYPFGSDVSLPGLRIFRCLRPPFLHRIGIGPSFAKIPLDLALTLTAIRRMLAGGYDAVHSHEEGGFIGVRPRLDDGRAASLRHALQPAPAVEQFRVQPLEAARGRVRVDGADRDPPVTGGDRDLPASRGDGPEHRPRRADRADRERPRIRRCAGRGLGPGSESDPGLGESTPVVLYTGTFEAYQGLDLLFAAAAEVKARRPDVRFVLAGGRPDQIEACRREAARAGIADVVMFAGQRPADEIPAYLDAADVLVSPRSTGTNTPLKIYQYLRSGRPIVATRLLTHTQVLDDGIAILTTPDAAGVAAGILSAIDDPEHARAIGASARRLAETKYSYESYLARTRQACDHLTREAAPQVAGGVA